MHLTTFPAIYFFLSLVILNFPLVMSLDSIAFLPIDIFCSYFWDPFIFVFYDAWNFTSIHLGSLLFNKQIHNTCVSIHCSTYLLFANDLKMYLNNVIACKLLHSDINFVQNWCRPMDNGIRLNADSLL
jgi:hypothetical protein